MFLTATKKAFGRLLKKCLKPFYVKQKERKKDFTEKIEALNMLP